MEQESVNPAIGSILDEQKLKNIVYPAKLFRTRLNEEFMRANRTRKPFLYIKMYSDNSAVTPQYLWVQQVFYLEEGKNIELKVEDHTKVGKTEP